ncbi:MAG: SIMPL domain-containing protein [Elusimicrobia bacterium]|nr:SIMPL domain-containing protein [Elusimicrobiota bacterium]
MRKVFGLLLGCFLAVSFVVPVFAEGEFSKEPSENGFSVCSKAEVYCYPDTLWIVCGIYSDGLSVDEALAENESNFERLKKTLNGKEFKNYKMKFFPVSIGQAGSSYEIRRKKSFGFKVNRQIVLEQKNINEKNIDAIMLGTAKTIDILSKSGVNNWGLERNYTETGTAVYFGLTDKEKHEDKAKKEAYQKLESEKEKEVKIAGVKIKKLKSLESKSSGLRDFYTIREGDILSEGLRSSIFKEFKIIGYVNAVYEIE